MAAKKTTPLGMGAHRALISGLKPKDWYPGYFSQRKEPGYIQEGGKVTYLCYAITDAISTGDEELLCTL